jgi:hypothetical protein
MKSYLWNSQASVEQKRIVKILTDLNPSQLVALNNFDLALLFQVIFSLNNSRTIGVRFKNNSFDLEMKKDGRKEYLRFYPQGPVAVLYQISTELKGRDIQKIHVFTFGSFSKSDHKEHQQYPLLVSFKERDEVIHFVREAQASYLEKYGRGLPGRSASNRRSHRNGFLSPILDWLIKLFSLN